MSSSLEKPRKRRFKTGSKSILCSTPVKVVPKSRTISISSIDTNSSSSIIARRLRRQPTKAEKKQKLAKAEKGQKPVKAEKEQNPAKTEKEQKLAKAKKGKKPAEKKTKARMNRKKTKPAKPVDTDSEWLTTLEQSDDEKENLEQSVRSPTKGLALFEDIASPELVREAQHFVDYHFDSPGHLRREVVASPVSNDLGDGEKSLPLEELPHLQTRFDSSDEEEDEMVFRRSYPVRTYPGRKDRQKKKREISIDKSKRWLVDLKVPTTAADMLWDEYVRKHPEEMREYIASPAERQKKSSSSEDYSRNADKGKVTKKEDWYSKEMWISQDMPQDMARVRGYFDTTSRKWVRKYIDPYMFPTSEDAEFDRRLTSDSDSQRAGPSCSKNERIAKQNVKDTKIEQKEKLQKRKPVQRALVTEFQRYNNLSSYATKLKAKEREMLSKNVNKNSNENTLVSANRITRKRANESNKDDSKRSKIAAQSIPTIKSIKKLVDKKYVKENDHWRVV